MAKFEFGTSTLELDIEQQHFEVDPAHLLPKMKGVGDALGAISKRLSPAQLTPDAIEKACGDLIACLEELLGEGAGQRIFKERTPSFYDCVALCQFVIGELNAFHQQKAKGRRGKK